MHAAAMQSGSGRPRHLKLDAVHPIAATILCFIEPLVGDRMTEAVVDGLEQVDVDHQYRHRLAEAVGAPGKVQ